jgi:hypothetical protein
MRGPFQITLDEFLTQVNWHKFERGWLCTLDCGPTFEIFAIADKQFRASMMHDEKEGCVEKEWFSDAAEWCFQRLQRHTADDRTGVGSSPQAIQARS